MLPIPTVDDEYVHMCDRHGHASLKTQPPINSDRLQEKVRSRGTPPYINQPRERSLDVLRGPNEGGSHLANNPFD